MTIVDNKTANRLYNLPHPDNDLADDVLRLIAALNGIDVDVASLFASLSGKAATVHSHNISDVTGLQAALNAKLDAGSALGIAQVTGLQGALDAKAPLASPQFSGAPSAPNPDAGENSTRLATTAWVKARGYLSGVVAITAGGTGATTQAGARAALNVPTRTGGDASGTWPISVTGSAATAASVTGTSSNGFGTRTVSTSDPTGGTDGDIWLKV